MIEAALQDQNERVQESPQNVGNNTVSKGPFPVLPMDKIAADANAALRAKGVAAVDDSGVGFMSARGIKRTSPPGGS
jgi:hypothetical protein